MSICIDADELCMARESSDLPQTWYLDLQTGEVLFAGDAMYTTDEEVVEQVEEDPDRYLLIQPVDSFQAFRIMENFTDNLPEGRVQDHLFRALGGRKPFRTFKDRLCDYPDVREAWFRFKEDEMCRSAEEWLNENEVEAELVRRERPRPK